MRRTAGILLAVSAIVIGFPPSSSAQRRAPTWGAPRDVTRFLTARYHPQRLIVKKRGMARPQLVPLQKGDDVLTHLSLLLDDEEIEYAEPDLLYTLDRVTPNDPDFSSLWGVEMIRAPEAWTVTRGSREIVVAVVDTGVDVEHPDLRENIWVNDGEIPDNRLDDDGNGYVDDYYGYNAIAPLRAPTDDNRHGTHVAGTIGAVGDNQIGITGVTWQVKIMAVKFLDKNGSGYLSDALRALDYILAMKRRGVNIRVVNASWGSDTYSQALEEAIQKLEREGILFVAAAGNESTSAMRYPAAHEGVIAVAAVEQNGDLTSFSNFGGWVDVAAPGRAIRSTVPGGGYANFSGTSMATPHVAGVAALSLSAREVSLDELRRALQQGVRLSPPLAGKVATGGIIDAMETLRALNADDPSKTCAHDCPPRVSLTADRLVVDDGETVSFTATGTDPDGDPLTYRWTTTAGVLKAGITSAQLITRGVNPAPGAPPVMITVTVTVEDGRGHSASASRSIAVRPPNRSPRVTVEASPQTVQDGALVLLTARGEDPDGDALTYTWTTSAGKITGSGSEVQLDTLNVNPVPDSDPVRVIISVRASDGRGGEATATTEVTVTAPPKVSIRAFPNSVTFRNGQATFYVAVSKHPSYRGSVRLNVISLDGGRELTVTLSPYRTLFTTHRVIATLTSPPREPRQYRVRVRGHAEDGRTYDSNVVTLWKR